LRLLQYSKGHSSKIKEQMNLLDFHASIVE
jgi:hypothetical protein